MFDTSLACARSFRQTYDSGFMPGKPNLASCRFVRHRYKGIAVYFFMNRIVVPLSNATKYPFSAKMMLIGVVIHIFA